MKKSFKPRKSGYYFVGWNYTPDMSGIVYHIGYYDETTQRWRMLGDDGWYSDANFIQIDETPIIRAKPVKWYHKALRDTFTGLVFIGWTVFFASVIAVILTWLLKCK